ncbi:unnamed protein product [Schistosoma margrebowiei]|uniref:Uncharacterized protein n=1 Tax=Schistosoma margrebowiei TaxID=48269 RepID=A0A183M9G5_9TREM|nr:unnamed protein product [Schistosoma margrebowiei]
MVVGGSQHETLDLDFVVFGTRQQGVTVILRELMLPEGIRSRVTIMSRTLMFITQGLHILFNHCIICLFTVIQTLNSLC